MGTVPPGLFFNPSFEPLSDRDYASLEERWITRDIADGAYLRRVSTLVGAELVGQPPRTGDYAGMAIPYLWPGDNHVSLYRLRRDHPDMEQGRDGKLKPRRKYLNAPGATNRLYIAPQTGLEQLGDATLPVVITEGEFKTLALWRLSWDGVGDSADRPAFVPLGLQGVWSFKGSVGKMPDADGVRVNITGVIPDLSRIAWQDRAVTILYDADVELNLDIARARQALTGALEDCGAIVSWFVWPPNTPPSQKGIDDFLYFNTVDRVKRLFTRARLKTKRKRAPTVTVIPSTDADTWKAELLRGDKGVKPLLANALTALRHSEAWVGAVSFNEFSMRTEVVAGTPWRPEPYLWADYDDTLLTEWLQREGIEVGETIASRAVEAVARQQGHHAVRDYLEGLVWDQSPRIDSWLHDYMGSVGGSAVPEELIPRSRYIAAVGARWLISAVARVMQPGCQADYALIFEGAQGKGKSSILRALACRDEWFTDNVGDFGSVEAKKQLPGKWLIEIAEMSQIVARRAEMETVKGFISQRSDNFRPSYGRRPADFPRQCVFAGSTNADVYLRDETGNRRFWPVYCPEADVKGLTVARDQLWAEAYHRWKLGEKWWLWEVDLVRTAEDEQDARLQRDPWDGPVWAYLTRSLSEWKTGGKSVAAYSVTVEDILGGGLNKKTGDWTPLDKQRVAAILRVRGMEFKRIWLEELGPDGKRQREYLFRWPTPLS
jgi:predicted P-loop ATPase